MTWHQNDMSYALVRLKELRSVLMEIYTNGLAMIGENRNTCALQNLSLKGLCNN